jgi:hypothetical protein
LGTLFDAPTESEHSNTFGGAWRISLRLARKTLWGVVELKHALTSAMMHIIARPRVHISLADMGFASLRSFGGVGFSLDCEPTVVEFEPWRTVEIEGTDLVDTRAQLELSELVERLRAIREKVGFRAIIKSVPRQHIGLGSKTSLALSILAANAVNRLGLLAWHAQHDVFLSFFCVSETPYYSAWPTAEGRTVLETASNPDTADAIAYDDTSRSAANIP